MRQEEAPTLHSAFKKMLIGRSDVVVCDKITGLSIIKELKIKNVKILKSSLPTFPVFHFLHKKHSELIPSITEMLTHMSRDKTIEKIRASILEELGLPQD